MVFLKTKHPLTKFFLNSLKTCLPQPLPIQGRPKEHHCQVNPKLSTATEHNKLLLLGRPRNRLFPMLNRQFSSFRKRHKVPNNPRLSPSSTCRSPNGGSAFGRKGNRSYLSKPIEVQMNSAARNNVVGQQPWYTSDLPTAAKLSPELRNILKPDRSQISINNTLTPAYIKPEVKSAVGANVKNFPSLQPNARPPSLVPSASASKRQ